MKMLAKSSLVPSVLTALVAITCTAQGAEGFGFSLLKSRNSTQANTTTSSSTRATTTSAPRLPVFLPLTTKRRPEPVTSSTAAPSPTTVIAPQESPLVLNLQARPALVQGDSGLPPVQSTVTGHYSPEKGYYALINIDNPYPAVVQPEGSEVQGYPDDTPAESPWSSYGLNQYPPTPWGDFSSAYGYSPYPWALPQVYGAPPMYPLGYGQYYNPYSNIYYPPRASEVGWGRYRRHVVPSPWAATAPSPYTYYYPYPQHYAFPIINPDARYIPYPQAPTERRSAPKEDAVSNVRSLRSQDYSLPEAPKVQEEKPKNRIHFAVPQVTPVPELKESPQKRSHHQGAYHHHVRHGHHYPHYNRRYSYYK